MGVKMLLRDFLLAKNVVLGIRSGNSSPPNDAKRVNAWKVGGNFDGSKYDS